MWNGERSSAKRADGTDMRAKWGWERSGGVPFAYGVPEEGSSPGQPHQGQVPVVLVPLGMSETLSNVGGEGGRVERAQPPGTQGNAQGWGHNSELPLGPPSATRSRSHQALAVPVAVLGRFCFSFLSEK